MDKDFEATVSLGSGDDMSWDLPEKSQSSHNLAMVTDKEDIGSCQLVERTDGIQNSCTEDVLMNSEEAELSEWPDISMVLNATGDVSHMPDSTMEHLGQPATDVPQAQSTASALHLSHPITEVLLVPPQSHRNSVNLSCYYYHSLHR